MDKIAALLLWNCNSNRLLFQNTIIDAQYGAVFNNNSPLTKHMTQAFSIAIVNLNEYLCLNILLIHKIDPSLRSNYFEHHRAKKYQ